MSRDAKKYFGQNFLQDGQIIERIIHNIGLHSDDHVVEIGPGRGALTEQLYGRSSFLSLIEIDNDLIPLLHKLMQSLQNKNSTSSEKTVWQIFQHDALQFQLTTIYQKRKIRVVGNLPYNISTPLLFHLLTQLQYIEDMHFMLQKEVVTRICAEPGSKDYGRLSIMIQYYCQCTDLFDVPPESFYPVPKVNSAVVRLQPHEHAPYPCQDMKLFEKLVATAFSQRRKTLRNTLKNFCDPAHIEQAGIDTSLRAENIAIAEYVRLCNILSEQTPTPAS
jgi:16S rRNA (adenine1518-N6/adenine1519-N6)-dimethyltransferase